MNMPWARWNRTTKIGRTAFAFACLTSFGLSGAFVGCDSSSEKPAEESSSSTADSHAGHSHAGDATGEAAERTTSILSLERRTEIWNREHLAFELEYRWAKPVFKSLQANDVALLLKSLKTDCELKTIDQSIETWEHANLTETRFAETPESDTENESNIVSADQWATRLKDRFALAGPEASARWQISRLTPLAAANQYSVEAQWWIKRSATAEQPAASWEGTDELTIEVETPESVDTQPFIVAWREKSRRELQGKKLWFEETTQLYRFDRQGIFDNRDPKLKPEDSLFFRFQMSVEDFNLDNRLDMAVASANDPPRVIRQQDNRVFLQRAMELGVDVPRPLPTVLVLWFDWDNDRDVDLIIGDRVYRNDNSLFVEVSETCGIEFVPYTMGGCVADYDLDGDLDLYLVYHQEIIPKKPLTSWLDGENCGRYNQLWQNQGDGTFKDVTAESKSGGGGRYSNGATFVHLNSDLYPDLVITNQFTRNVFLINQGDGTFADVTRQYGAENISVNNGIATGDLNQDGTTDVLLAGRSSLVADRILAGLTEQDHDATIRGHLMSLAQGNQLWLTSEDGVTRGSPSIEAIQTGWTYGPAIADMDNDGYLDVVAATGHQSFDAESPDNSSPFWQSMVIAPEDYFAKVTAKGTLDEKLGEPWDEVPTTLIGQPKNFASFEPNRFLLGGADLRFRDVSFISGLDIDSDSRTLIPCDLDRDGALDLIVGSVGGGPLRSFRNTAATGHWLGIQLHGKESNAYGIGARISVTVQGRKLVRDLFHSSSFMGNGPAETHFGLGDAQVIDQLEIRWPSGHVTTASQVPVDQWTRWSEATDSFETLPKLEFEEQAEASAETTEETP